MNCFILYIRVALFLSLHIRGFGIVSSSAAQCRAVRFFCTYIVDRGEREREREAGWSDNFWRLKMHPCSTTSAESYSTYEGRAIAEAVGGPGSIPGLVKWDLWWTKWRGGRFSPSTSVSPAIHSTKFSILTITRGRYNRPVSDRRAEWTQFGLHPPLCKLKKWLHVRSF
jgi:hypothetical protein